MNALNHFLHNKLKLFLANPKSTIRLPEFDLPRISILLVVFNRAPLTYQCLESILANADVPYELVIIDNGSSDETGELLNRIKNVTLIRNSENEGFLKACNRGAKRAVGDWILFLNNDTQVMPTALSSLYETTRRMDRCGAVGGKLVFPDGKLQEAGGIIWQDGSCTGYGRGDDPLKPEYSYLREVHYCSGACLLVRKNLFFRIGLFNECFAPAYYEDVNLCMALRERGFKIVYQPQACVIHYEFGSADSVNEAIALQTVHKQIFHNLWRETLKAFHPPFASGNMLYSRECCFDSKPRLLMVDDRIPDPALGSGFPRAYNILESLVELDCRVTLFPMTFQDRIEPCASGLQQKGIEIYYRSNGIPVVFEDFFRERKDLYDAVWISRPHNMSATADIIRAIAPETKIIYDAEALFSVRDILQLELEGSVLTDEEKKSLLDQEIDLVNRADVVVAVSDNEKLLVEKNSTRQVKVLGQSYELNPTSTPFENREDILFVGSFLSSPSPNEDAVRFFISDIYPKVYQVTGAQLFVVGTNELESITRLETDCIRVVGRVDDLREYYDRCRVFIVPHRYCAGIPLKLLESLSFGLPAVVTSLIAGQLNIDDRIVFIGSTADQFADKLIEAYTNPKRWQTLRENGLTFMKNNYSDSLFRGCLVDIIQSVEGFSSFASGKSDTRYENKEMGIPTHKEIQEIEALSGIQAEHLEKTAIERFGKAERTEDDDWSIIKSEKMLQGIESQISALTEDNYRRGEWALGLQKQLDEAQAAIAQITSGNSWRLTLPLREMRRWLTQPSAQARRYLQRIASGCKKIYQKVFQNERTKTAHKIILAKYCPGILRITNSMPVVPGGSPEPHVSRCLPVYSAAERTELAVCLDMPLSPHPVVSVIIPVHGQCDHTLACLASIADHPPDAPVEIIVVDDASPDASADILQNIKNIRLIRKEINEGFIRTCNTGAAAATGQYLYFLNNDTQVTAGWLDELLRTFDEFPGTGLAGSKLLYPDGTLQEAGCIIWQNGSAWNFGRNQDASLPVYNYAREVDYVSGASLMVPKRLFDELGGFDENYLPAYCEDDDLALKIRENGYRVIYQPLSVVYHFEGATGGSDTAEGAKAHQIENTKKLFNRWKHRLSKHQPNGVNVDSAKDRRAKRRVLVLDLCTPTPDQDSGSIDAFNLLLLLREMDFQATFIPEDNFCYMPGYTQSLQRIGVEVLYAPHVKSVEQHLKDYGERYDLVFMFRVSVVGRNIALVKKYCPRAKLLFNTVDLHHLRLMREAMLLGDETKMKIAEDMKQAEFQAIQSVDAATVVSSEELQRLKAELPDAPIHLLPFSRHIDGTQTGFAGRRDIVFVGGYQHPPNLDAVQHFITDIMPLLRRRLPGVRFYAVGSNTPEDIQQLASEDVIITGYVKDLNTLLDCMKISVAPLRYGAGIKGKISSALAVGLPVVATPLATEGMSLEDGEHILVADGAQAFVDAIARLYEDEILWNKLSRAGVSFARQAWGVDAGWRNLADVLSKLGFETRRNGYPLSLYSPAAGPKRKTESA